jgi:hypothetical protein
MFVGEERAFRRSDSGIGRVAPASAAARRSWRRPPVPAAAPPAARPRAQRPHSAAPL